MQSDSDNPNPQSHETHIIVHEAPKDYRGLTKTSWILLSIACLVSLIPFVGFASWFIAGPVFLATFILSIIILTRGGTLQGILVMLFSMFVAPVIVICAPFVSSFVASLLGLAGLGMAGDHASNQTPSRAQSGVNTMSARFVGYWNSPRHGYIYRDNGTWEMIPEGDGLLNGRWQIQGDILTITCSIDPPTTKPQIYTILSLDEKEIAYKDTQKDVVYKMQRAN